MKWTILIFLLMLFPLISADFPVVSIEVPDRPDVTLTGNLTNLSQLGDTNIPAPGDSQLLTYNSTSGFWEAQGLGAIGDTNATTECAGDEALLGNGSCITTSAFGGADTNETSRFENLTAINCTGTNKMTGVYPNGTVTCAADQDSGVTNIFDQVLNTTSNVTFNNVTVTQNVSANWFKGFFDWIIGSTSTPYLQFNGSQLDFNETKLNTTINASIDIRGSPHNFIQDPTANSSINFGNNLLEFIFVTPSDEAFAIEGRGAFNGDLLHIHQHTGNPSAVNLVHLHADDPDVLPLLVMGTNPLAINVTFGNISLADGQLLASSWDNVSITESQISDLSHTNISNLIDQIVNTTSNVVFNSVNVTTIIRASNWSNVSITESQISDLAHNGTVDTNETSRFENLTGVNCGGDNKVIGVFDNGTVECSADLQGAGTSKAGDGVYLFNDSTTISFNTTLAGTNLSVNSSDYWDNFNDVNTTQFSNTGGTLTIVQAWFSSFFDNLFGGKDTDDLTQGSTNLYDNRSWNETLADLLYADISQSDTNETSRFENLTAFDCPVGRVANGVEANGTISCVADADSGTTNIFDQDLNTTDDVAFNSVNATTIIRSGNWSNVSITESQISDLAHNGTVDTNASTECSTDEVLLGNTTCVNTAPFFDDTDTNETTRVNALTSRNCTGTDKVSGSFGNGTFICGEDLQGAGTGKQGDGIYLYNDSDTMYYNDTLAGTNLSVNSSDYWDSVNDFNTTQLSNTGGTLTIVQAWFSSFFDNLFGGKDTDDLTQGSSNFYDNRSWNETLANSLYADISQSDTNETSRFENLTGVNCGGTNKMIGVFDNGTVECGSDVTGAGGKSGAAPYLYNDSSDIILNDTVLNATIENLDTDTFVANYSDFLNKVSWSDTGNGTLATADSIWATLSNGTVVLLSTLNNGTYITLGVLNNGTYTDTDTFVANYSDFLNKVSWADATNGTLATEDSIWATLSNGTVVLLSTLNNGTYVTLSVLNNGTYTDTDTNETSRFDNLTSFNCAGTDKMLGVFANGTAECSAVTATVQDVWVNTTGEDWNTSQHIVPTANNTYDLGNSTNYFKDIFVSGLNIITRIVTNQIANGAITAVKLALNAVNTSHITDGTILTEDMSAGFNTTYDIRWLDDTDTNATTECATDEALLGNGTCVTTSIFLPGAVPDVWVNTTGDTMTGNLVVNANVTVNQDSFIFLGVGGNITHNGTTLIIRGNTTTFRLW